VAPTRPLNLETACAAPQQLPADGVLDFPNFLLDPGLNGLSRTKYIVVRRVLTVAPSALPTDRPIVAAAVFVDPSVEEAYTGDNVLFGFAPGVTQAPASLPVNKKH